jgi:5-methylcytosine-specific restriction protein A
LLAPKPCAQCGTLVGDGSARCDAHKRNAWQRYGNTTKRTAGRRLQRDRAALFAREPLCRECQRHGRVTLATIRDHIVPLAEGGADDDANTQPLCQACSDAKTEAESKRGRAWGRGGI